jgi:hypothetical protein
MEGGGSGKIEILLSETMKRFSWGITGVPTRLELSTSRTIPDS